MGWVSSVSAFCCSGRGCVCCYQSYNLVPVWVGNANPLPSSCWVNSTRKRNSRSGPIATSKAPQLPLPLPFPYSTSTCRYNGKPTLKVKGLINNNNCNCNCNYKSNILIANCSPGTGTESTDTTDTTCTELQDSSFDCVGTGQDVECVVSSDPEETTRVGGLNSELIQQVQEWAVLVSPFFFWGTSMVAMKGVLPRAGPFFVSAFRLIPAGLLLIAFAASRRRPFPSGLTAWLSIALFGLVDAACFQGFLAQGLQRTSAGLGSVIIDSQPLTVAVLAALFFGESIGFLGAAGLLLGVFGLLLLEAPSIGYDGSNFSLWQSGEWWMLLAAQSMAVGTVMVRWVSKYSDPVMATGWHMVIGGLPLVIISILNHENAVSGSLMKFTENDTLALLYTSIFGSAISYGVYFYSATKGSLTRLSSLTFLTPMFASIFGFLYLGETFSPLQLGGAIVTLVAIYMVNYKT